MLTKLKNIVFLLFLITLFIPMIEEKIQQIEFLPLEGVQEKTKKPVLDLRNWLSSSFQECYVKYIEENIPFRTWLIRLRNQIRYSLFNETSASKIVIGKEGYLYEQDYINAYLGKDYIGEESMKSRLKQLESLQNTFKSQGKDLMLVIVPGKATFYPEYLPDRFKRPDNCKTNYDLFCRLIKEYKINTIDFQKYFLDNKNKSPYPLIPKCGIHWSYYGMSLAVDSIIKYIEQLRNINLPDLKISNYVTSEIPQNPDYDLGNLLNIITLIKQPTLYYPVYNYYVSSSHTKPKVLTIGDSFYWNLYNDSIPQRLFDNVQFWYYANSVYPESFSSPLTISQIDVKSEINKQDIILIIITEFGLGNIGYGFVDIANSVIQNNTSNYVPSNDLVQSYILRIKSSEDWMKDIARKAKEANISVEEQLKIDAEWLLKQENSGLNDRINYYVNAIKSDPEWMAAIKEKAEKNNISTEEMILKDATWIAENENPKQ